MSARLRHARRNPERGSVTILVAALWMALFGMAALAVDAGHMYLTKRNLQDAADAAVMAGLPTLGSNTTTAQTNARNMGIQCGYPSGNIATSTGAAGGFTTLTVTITASEPFFFAKVLGYASKTVSATAVGQASSAVPAVFAGRNTCGGSPTAVGIQFNGGPVDVTGDIQSNGTANIYGSGSISGSSVYGAGCTSNIAGATNTGGSLAYPYSYTTSSFGGCDFGSLSTPTLSLGGPGPWWASGGPSGGTLATGVYCASSQIDASAGSFLNGTVTFVTPGRITISSATVNLTAYSNGILAYAGAASDCYTNQAINVGSGSITINGSFDAPNGCVNASGSVLNVNGSLVGNEVQFGAGMASTIDAGGGGGAGYWMYQ
ncbi:MAG TPA: TadE/TadG family type IV pilus assembly protein [Polyangia bacterium]|nr:TadE/TadG family type IV pilus assembly protein [Polyangia bacterium]